MVPGEGRANRPSDRSAWLQERRAAAEAEYDTEAADYDSDPYPRTSHEAFVRQLLETCPADGTVLDAPCGTGKYFDQVRAAGRQVVGIDQSAGMLEQARAKGIATSLQHVGLQDLTFDRAFDGAMTIDAMEYVAPEDWPSVLANLRRAIRRGGHLYLTVEERDQGAIDAAFAEAQVQGLPALHGEITGGGAGAYHYYPGRERVMRWLDAEGFDVVAEAFDQEDGWGYRHLLVRSR